MNKNLNFCLTPGYYNKEELKRDIKTFTREIKLREHFYNNNENQQAEKIVTEPIIKCKSNWEPKKNHHTIETFVEAVENNVENILQEKKKLPRNYFSESDKAAIDYFTKREEIVITKTDKGGPTAIMDVDECISKANQQLTDGNFHRKLNEDPTRKYSDIVNNTIKSFKKQELLLLKRTTI